MIIVLVSLSALLTIILMSIISSRNCEVYKYRMNLLSKVNARCDNDIKNGMDFRWRYDMYEAVKYDDMVNKFWKPLDSFYDVDKILGDKK